MSDDTYTNKVFQVLRSFDAGEHKRLMKFLHSPYFNQSKTLAQLCGILIGFAEHAKPGFDRLALWQKLFPSEPYEDVNFRKYCSDLLKIMEAFMVHENAERDEAKTALGVLDFVVRRKIEPLYNGAMKQARNALEKQPYRSLDFYYQNYSIERRYYALMDFDVRLNTKTNLEEIAFNLDLFYWIEKLKLYCAVLSQRKTGNQAYKLNFADELISQLQRFPIEEVPALAIYYYSFLILTEEENVEHYYNFRRMLDKYGMDMPQQEAMEMFDSALHYCTGKINKGQREFLQEYFNLFEDAITKGIFLLQGQLAPWRFNNIVVAALRLGKMDWAEHFVEHYKTYLHEDSRQNVYSFNLARVLLYQHKYDRVLELLQDVEYEDIFYNIISKAILTVTYYEMKEEDALDSFLESFRVFLIRNKNVTPQYRTLHLNLIKYVRRLIRLVPGDKTAIEKLRQEITREKSNTVNHEWLLEKLAEREG